MHLVETMAYAGEKPWHGLGNKLAPQQPIEAWRQQARRHVEGLSRSIDAQLEGWRLSPAEKEVAFLLLKGLGLREIADLRGTHEKTVRAQSASIYAKAGLAGRSELAAFFLEDLLVPRADLDPGLTRPAAPPAP